MVDATNYVMLELNQPMHAYDAATPRVGPRWWSGGPGAGERVVTLDDVERTLDAEMMAIADAKGVIGLAGVMGGAATEVSRETRRRAARGRLLGSAAGSAAPGAPSG